MENIENQEKQDVIDNDENLDYIESYTNDFKGRTWKISIKDTLYTKERIEEVYQANKKQIRKLAYCLHNHDFNNDGSKKDNHYHIVFVCKSPCRVSTVHNWFNLPKGQVRICNSRKGRNGFNDMIVYFTHLKFNNDIGKTHYSIDEITTLGEEIDIASIVENELCNQSASNKKELKKALKEQLLRNEISLSEIQEKYQDIYVDNIRQFDDINRKKIDLLPLPKERINFYITGKGGFGKDFLSDLLSYHLTSDAKDIDIESTKERVFTCGSPKVALQNYAGQECIIYRDYRAGNLLDCFGGRGGVFNAFDTIPKDASNNIKYGEVTLKNKYSIVNSVQSFSNFTNALCEISDREVREYAFNEELANQKRYENKTQVIRRFAFIFVIEENSIILGINKNFLDSKDNLEEYAKLEISINFRHAIEVIKKASDASQERIFNNARKVLKEMLDVIDNALRTHVENREYKEESQSELQELIDSVKCSFQEVNGVIPNPVDYFEKLYKLRNELFRTKEREPKVIHEVRSIPFRCDAPKREDVFKEDLNNEDN